MIFAPSNIEKARLRLIVPELNDLVLKECDPDVVHGFVPGRSPVTNAWKHVGYRFTLSMDLKDFFDSIRPSHVNENPEFMNCFLSMKKRTWTTESAPRQGLPTSPAISNLAGIMMDAKIKAAAEMHGCVYTRYADDISISGNDVNDLRLIKKTVEQVVVQCGFFVNDRKTRIQSAEFGRRNITGVMVDGTGVYPTRSIKRKLRAARHQGRKSHAAGLAEWCRLRLPKPGGSDRISPVKRASAHNTARKLRMEKNVWSS